MLTIQQIYDLAVHHGIENDPRGAKRAREVLREAREQYDQLAKDEKQYFDREKFTNPYSDSRLYADHRSRPVKRVLVGIDIGVAEILLAKELGREGKPIDLVISHHPVGRALAGLHEVMYMQAEILAKYGVPINIAESMLAKRVEEVSRSISPHNHYQPVDAARLIDMPVMCAHTLADNMVTTYMEKYFAKRAKKIRYIKDVLEVLSEFPEYQEAKRRGAGPMVISGTPKRFTGKLAFTELTGGTEGAQEIYEKVSQAGIGTLISMHMTEKRKDEAVKHHVNVIVAGHIASDSIGMNLYLDQLERRGIEIVPTGGFIRVSRLPKRKSPLRKAKRPRSTVRTRRRR